MPLFSATIIVLKYDCMIAYNVLNVLISARWFIYEKKINIAVEGGRGCPAYKHRKMSLITISQKSNQF